MGNSTDARQNSPNIAATILVIAVLIIGVYQLTRINRQSGRSPRGQIHGRTDLSGTSAGFMSGIAVIGDRDQPAAELAAIDDSSGDPAVPAAVVPDTTSHLVNMLQPGPGIALWIKVKSDLGLIDVRLQPGVATHSIGRNLLRTVVSTSADGVSLPVTEWLGSDGKPVGPGQFEPYRVEPVWAGDPSSSPLSTRLFGSLLLVPKDIESRVRVLATPLDSAGKPCFPPVRLRAQPVGPHLVFVRIPGSYADDTKQFRVSVSDGPLSAAWTISNLPESRMIAAPDEMTQQPLQLGTLTMQVSASEADDIWFPWSPPNQKMLDTTAWNADDHYSTGLPTLNCKVSLASGDVKDGDEWRVAIQNIKPQWTGHAPGDSQQAGNADFVPLICKAGEKSVIRQYAVGSDYPGQQQCVLIQGVADRIHQTRETVTLTDGDLRYSRASGRWMVHWDGRELATTPSGVSVAPFNRRIGSDMSQVDSGAAWPAANACELCIGVRTPPTLPISTVTTVETSAPIQTLSVSSPHDGWRTFWVPGAEPFVRHTSRRLLGDSPIFPYYHDGFNPLTLAVSDGAKRAADVLAGEIPACPLPAHLPALTLVVTTSTVIEHHAFSIVAPVKRRLK